MELFFRRHLRSCAANSHGHGGRDDFKAVLGCTVEVVGISVLVAVLETALLATMFWRTGTWGLQCWALLCACAVSLVRERLWNPNFMIGYVVRKMWTTFFFTLRIFAVVGLTLSYVVHAVVYRNTLISLMLAVSDLDHCYIAHAFVVGFYTYLTIIRSRIYWLPLPAPQHILRRAVALHGYGRH